MTIKPTHENSNQMIELLDSESIASGPLTRYYSGDMILRSDDKIWNVLLEDQEICKPAAGKEMHLLWTPPFDKRNFTNDKFIGNETAVGHNIKEEGGLESGYSTPQLKEGTDGYFLKYNRLSFKNQGAENLLEEKSSKTDLPEGLARKKQILSMQKLRKTMTGVVRAMAMTIALRDRYTASHQQRVTNIACAVARQMDLSVDKVQGVRMASLIHDLGKISIPAEILSKTGKITDIEFSLIKNHPRTGYDILKEIAFPWPLAQIVLQHHERLDGSGYPFGLAGNEILLEARILAVADVIDAMASHRPYRAALGLNRAFRELSDKRGTCFDREVVDAAIYVVSENGFNYN